ncbi:hypothetical protein SOVF_113880 [Spinacia oleracea]|nr:hypothetical protein SOVF_113880 [Spinacia oleracea]
MNIEDCSLRLCTTNCPKWCDGIFIPLTPPPPPPPFSFPEENSQLSPTFSPLVIAIIGILASAFLLVSYYALISKYCGKNNNNRVNQLSSNNGGIIVDDDYDGNGNHQHEPWFVTTTGLDEGLIKSITIFKYKKGDCLIGSSGSRNGESDCSVCLGEFVEDDDLRLLPKCNHAFHVSCIDTWLRSHSNCPLCRANIISSASLVVANIDNNNNNNNGVQVQDHNGVLENQGQSEEGSDFLVEEASGNLPKTPFRALSDLGVRGYGGEDTMRRSISMDHRYEARVSIPDQYHDQSLKRVAGESSKFGVCSGGSGGGGSSRRVVLHGVSSGRFLFSKHGRGKNAVIIPL